MKKGPTGVVLLCVLMLLVSTCSYLILTGPETTNSMGARGIKTIIAEVGTRNAKTMTVSAEGKDLTIYYIHLDSYRYEYGGGLLRCRIEITDIPEVAYTSIDKKGIDMSRYFSISGFAEGYNADQNSAELFLLFLYPPSFGEKARNNQSVLQNIILDNPAKEGKKKIREIVIQVLKKLHPEKTKKI